MWWFLCTIRFLFWQAWTWRRIGRIAAAEIRSQDGASFDPSCHETQARIEERRAAIEDAQFDAWMRRKA